MASLVTSPDSMPPPRRDMSVVPAAHSPPQSPSRSFSSTSSRRSSVTLRRQSEEEVLHPNTYQIAPPPEQEYSSPKVAEGEIHAWTKTLCYELSRTKSDKNKDGIVYKQYYKCTKHGKPSNTRKLTEETRVRRRTSGRTGCPMGVVVKAVDPKAPDGRWKIQHQMNGKSFFHNHPPAPHASALSGHRRRAATDHVKSIVQKKKTTRTPAKQTIEAS